jgi:hypothetical protein
MDLARSALTFSIRMIRPSAEVEVSHEWHLKRLRRVL